jgi:hypothetical protein
VSLQELQDLAVGTLTGIGATTLFLLALWIGFCVVAGFSKLRPTSRKTRVVRSLDELVGQEAHARFLPPDAPRGPVDQLRTPELLEAAARKGT